MWFLIILFFIALFFEGTMTLFPVSLALLIILSMTMKKVWVFFLAFIGGLILDILFLRPLGTTAAVFIIFLFLIFLYERKYEIRSVLFVLIASYIGSCLYLFIFHNTHILFKSLLVAIVGTGCYLFYTFGSTFRLRTRV